jgi:hypothetical protein
MSQQKWILIGCYKYYFEGLAIGSSTLIIQLKAILDFKRVNHQTEYVYPEYLNL